MALKQMLKAVEPLSVRCSTCGCLLFEVVGDVIIIKSDHHGERHTSLVRLQELAGTAVRLSSGKVVNLSP